MHRVVMPQHHVLPPTSDNCQLLFQIAPLARGEAVSVISASFLLKCNVRSGHSGLRPDSDLELCGTIRGEQGHCRGTERAAVGLQLAAATAVTAASAPSSMLPLFLLNRQDRMNLLHKGFFFLQR